MMKEMNFYSVSAVYGDKITMRGCAIPKVELVMHPQYYSWDQVAELRPRMDISPSGVIPVDMVENVQDTTYAKADEVVFATICNADGDCHSVVKRIYDKDGQRFFDYYDLQRIFRLGREEMKFFLIRDGFIFRVIW